MSRYEEALERLKQAERECIAALIAECAPEEPMVQDEKTGKWLSKDEVIARILRGEDGFDYEEESI